MSDEPQAEDGLPRIEDLPIEGMLGSGDSILMRAVRRAYEQADLEPRYSAHGSSPVL